MENMENTNKIPVRIGRHTYFAELDSVASALPNAKPTYRAYTADGTYFMHLAGWEFDNCRTKQLAKEAK